MKRILIAIIILTAGVAAAQQDIRYVGGVAVDLGPAYAWQAHKKESGFNKEERPLKHWRVIKIKSIDDQLGSWDKCTVETEEGTSAQILLQNIPLSCREVIMRYQETTKQLIALQDAQAQNRLAGDPGNWYQRRQLASNSEVIAVNLEKVKQEQTMAAEASLKAKAQLLLGMFTGRRYGGLEVWDCGRKG